MPEKKHRVSHHKRRPPEVATMKQIEEGQRSSDKLSAPPARDISNRQEQPSSGCPYRKTNLSGSPARDISTHKEQPSSGCPYRKTISRVFWLFLIGGIVASVVALAKYFKSHDLKFRQDEPGNTPITLSELALHNTPEDCWVALHGNVYDLTSYANRHPDASFITDLAGMDGTLDYDIFHPTSLLAIVRGYILGPLVAKEQTDGDDEPEEKTEPTEDDGFITLAELRTHSTSDDCWVAIYGLVYDLTDYANNRHPDGARSITRYAGTECTSAYARDHKENILRTLRDNEAIGVFAGR
jgi:cytochrome b involved in lipid metabolism